MLVSIVGLELSAIAGPANDRTDSIIVGEELPTGDKITPTAASGAIFQDLDPRYASAPTIRANQAAASSVSPDGRLLAVLTSGHNLHYDRNSNIAPDLSSENIFIFDITGAQPKQIDVLPIPNSFQGLSWAPSSDKVFVSGGMDDTVIEYARNGSSFILSRTFSLGHKFCGGLDQDKDSAPWAFACRPEAAGIAVSPDGKRLLVANLENDSVSLIDLESGHIVAEQDLRPGGSDRKRHGQPGGSYPRCVIWTSSDHAYVGSERDREVISLAILRQKIEIVRRISVRGQPTALITNRKGSRLYATLDNTDQVAIFDTARDALIERFSVTAPDDIYRNTKKLGGADPNALALVPDGRLLLVSNGGENALAVVRLSDRARGLTDNGSMRDRKGDDSGMTDGRRSRVVGLAPTGWYPTGVAVAEDGATWYVVNGKSPAGPNVGWCRSEVSSHSECPLELPSGTQPTFASNGWTMLRRYDAANVQLEKAGLLAFPAPSLLELARLTKQVASNDHFGSLDTSRKDEELYSFLKARIHHVIYIIKENRTYDQILGDLEIGNGDPRLTIFPERVSRNHHALARQFVTLDNVLLSGEGSWDGWDWNTAARTNDFRERQEVASWRGAMQGDKWGANRGINVGHATSDERHAELPISPSDPDILPGARDVGALDGPGGDEGKGYIWDAAFRAGLTVRNYGYYELLGSNAPLVRDPFEQKTRVFFPTVPSLMTVSDPYYRGWDPALPDYWRYREWKREFDAFSKSKTLPNLVLIELGDDHLGMFDKAIDGVNTPETQMADNDYALGLIVEAVANSPFAQDTLIISLEDDPSDGPDHVDAFRSLVFVAGPYVRQHAVVSTRYTSVSVVKTIEEVLGIGPIGLNDALAAPMSDVFDPNQASWTYKAIVPDVLRSTELPLPPMNHALIELPRHSAEYWAKAVLGQDFSGPDRIDAVSFNQALWRGLKGDARAESRKSETRH